jgi:hypothetical protein
MTQRVPETIRAVSSQSGAQFGALKDSRPLILNVRNSSKTIRDKDKVTRWVLEEELSTRLVLTDGKDKTLAGAHVQTQFCWLHITITITSTSKRLPSHHNHVTTDSRTSEKARA